MNNITFNELPHAVMMLFDKLDSIEKMLQNSQPTSPAEADDFLSVKEAAAFVKLAVPTVYGLVQRAEIPVCKRSKRLYFSRSELMSWVQDGRRKTASEISNDAQTHLSIIKGRRNKQW